MFGRQGRITVVPQEGLTGIKIEDEVDTLVSQALDEGATDFNDIREGEGSLVNTRGVRSGHALAGNRQDDGELKLGRAE